MSQFATFNPSRYSGLEPSYYAQQQLTTWSQGGDVGFLGDAEAPAKDKGAIWATLAEFAFNVGQKIVSNKQEQKQQAKLQEQAARLEMEQQRSAAIQAELAAKNEAIRQAYIRKAMYAGAATLILGGIGAGVVLYRRRG